MKVSFRHLAWICLLLCGNAGGQTATYTVKPGDNLSKIARAQGCSVEALAKANGIKLSAIIQAGQKLKLPAKPGAAPSGGNHVIQQGDTFSSISRQHDISVHALLAANPGLDPKALRPGQKILLPGETKATNAEKPASARDDSVGTSGVPLPSQSEPGAAVGAISETAQNADDVRENEPSEEKIRTILVDAEITFGEFATQYGSDIQRLNELNGLDLAGATVLAKGSELYVPVQSKDQP